MKRAALFLLAASLLLGASPLFAAPPKEDADIKLGRDSHAELLKSGIKLLTDPVQQARVEKIGRKLADLVNVEIIPATYGTENKTKFEYKFFLVDDKDINAFSLPGGYIYLNKGLLSYVQSDDELAGVLGHEITHAAHHHVARLQKEQGRLNSQMAIGALVAIFAKLPTTDTGNLLQGMQLLALQKVSGFSQNAERDADHGGIVLTQKAGYNPVGLLTFMERLERDRKLRPDIDMGIFRTHPPEQERANNMTAQITGLGLPINRRETAQILKVTVRDSASGPSVGPAGVTDVLLDGKLFFRAASPDRAKEIAATLDKALDRPLQLYDLSRRGPSVYVRNQSVLTVAAGEVAPPGSIDSAADAALKTLRTALYRYILEGVY